MPPVTVEKTIRELYVDARKAAEQTDCLVKWKMYGFEDFQYWADVRNKCQTELFWFSTEILGYDLVEAHRKITDEFFLKKNPATPIHELSPIKNRLILYPRGSFKSSIDEADTVQWIICYPNIRIGLMTGIDDLALSFVKNVKRFFQIGERAHLTKFQMLFFEHCVKANRKEDAAVFVTRARTKNLAQATLEALSLMASTSGFHYDIGKFDDVVTNKNSGPGSTSESRRSVYEAMRFAAALIEPFGYRFYLGTPYDADDAWSYLQNKTKKLISLKAPAFIIKEHATGKSIPELRDEDVELLFPVDRKGIPRLTLEFLQQEFEADEYIFACNYLLDPQRIRTVKFTEDLLRQRITQASGLPQAGTYRTFAAWDFADSTGKRSDYSVGVVGYLDIFGRLFIIEVDRGKYSPTELSAHVADLAARWRVERIYIEKSPGADFLENSIMQDLSKNCYLDCGRPEWIPIDNQKGAKVKRAEILEKYLYQGTLWFSATIPNMEDIITEFTMFKPDTNRKDDIIDAIAHLCRVMPAKIDLPESQAEQTTIVYDILAKKQLHDLIYGVRENTPPATTQETPLAVFDGAPVVCPHCGCAPCLGA